MRLRKAIGYTRRSTKKQKGSEEAQIDGIEEFAKKYGFGIIQFYHETASGKTIERPELEKALQHAQREGIPIIVDSISRIGRDAEQVIGLLNTYSFFSVEDGFNAEKSVLYLSAIEAQKEGKRISRRTRNGLKVAKKKGVAIGNPNIKEAQKMATKGNIQNADEFALQFEEVFERMERESHSFVARQMERMKVKTRCDGKWTAQTVINLRNRLKCIKEERQREDDNVVDLFEYVAQMFESGDFNPGAFK